MTLSYDALRSCVYAGYFLPTPLIQIKQLYVLWNNNNKSGTPFLFNNMCLGYEANSCQRDAKRFVKGKFHTITGREGPEEE
jgi:hypothetical protein